MTEVFYRDDYMWNPRTCDCECWKAFNIGEYLNFKNWSSKKHLIGKLVLESEDEILNTTETSLDDKKVTSKKDNCLIHTISLIIICLLLLAAVSIGCYYYYTRYWTKKEYVVSCSYKMNYLKEIHIKNPTCYYFDDIFKIEDFNSINIR